MWWSKISFWTFYETISYDTSNNIITDGKIPNGLNLIAFDFYLSTLLFDHMYAEMLDWFSRNGKNKACKCFEEKDIKNIRRALSFFKDGPMTDDMESQKLDCDILDMAFNCRMRSSLELLMKENHESGRNDLKIMLIGESSANGLLEFDSRGNIEPGQPQLLVEKRMLDEVKRTFRYYIDNLDIFNGGLMFFLYPDAHDYSINLFIKGAQGAPSVLNYIYTRKNNG